MIERNLKAIREKLLARGLDAVLITDDITRRYVTQMPDSAGAVLVGLNSAAVMTDFRYIEAAQCCRPAFSVEMVEKRDGYGAAAEAHLTAWGAKRVGFEDDRMTFADYTVWKAALSAELVPAGDIVSDLRVCKTEAEIGSLIAAQRIAERAWEQMLPIIRPGISEIELRGELAAICYRLGAENMSFDPIVASGPNSSRPHAVPGERRVQHGDFVTFDFGVCVNGYCSDMTRTVAIGEATEEMRRIYGLVLEAQLAAEDMLRAGVSYTDFDGCARKVIADAGYGPNFGHSLSHGIGLEIHEAAFTSDSGKILPAGAIVSVEPGIYLEGRFGVRIEDMALVTPEGCRILTDCPKELLIL